jgi:hypothetical protein
LLELIQRQSDAIETLQILEMQHYKTNEAAVETLSVKLAAVGKSALRLEEGRPQAAVAQPNPVDSDISNQITTFSYDRKIFAVQGQMKSANPDRIRLRKAKAVIVSAADTKYYNALKNLIGSVQFWDSTRNMVVFDLGLQPSERAELAKIDRLLVLDSPIKQDLKNYAWKALCLKQATSTYGKTIWLDAGSDMRGDPAVIDALLEKEDTFFVQGQDINMSPWAHERTLEFFQTNKQQVTDKYSFSGNLQGYVYDSQAYWEVLLVVEKCCLIRECIAPSGSGLHNHRYDQIAMSSAIYTSPWMTIIPHTELLAAERHQLEMDHTKPSSHVVYSGRGSSSEYQRYIHRSGIAFDAPTVNEIMSRP